MSDPWMPVCAVEGCAGIPLTNDVACDACTTAEWLFEVTKEKRSGLTGGGRRFDAEDALRLEQRRKGRKR